MKHYTESNRMAWNQTMPKHQKAKGRIWDEKFSIPRFSTFSNPELRLLKRLGIEGKSIAHLCCNNGVELMSLKNMGAGRCVGFDISDAAVAEATTRAKKLTSIVNSTEPMSMRSAIPSIMNLILYTLA